MLKLHLTDQTDTFICQTYNLPSKTISPEFDTIFFNLSLYIQVLIALRKY
nr:MAG TPA: hypothetical protein [Bacteriophage sp.]